MFKIDEMDNVKEFKIIYKDGSEINYDENGYSYGTTVEGENSSSHVLVSKDSIDMSVNEKIKSAVIEEANISNLDCSRLQAGQLNLNTDRVISWVSDGESCLNQAMDECMCEECHKDEEDIDGEKSIYGAILDYAVDKIEKELWDTLENIENEPDCCENFVIRNALEEAYSEGFKSALYELSYRNEQSNDLNTYELLKEVEELGFGDEDY